MEGGWLVNGRKIFASLSGAADYYGILCTETRATSIPTRRDTLYLAVPAERQGVAVSGDWNPLGMRGTVSRNLAFKDVFVDDDEQLMPRGVYFKARRRWPAMFFTLAPTYLGIANAAYDFTVSYLRGEMPGRAAGDKAAHVPDQADRGGADAHPARADKALSSRRASEARRPVQGRKAAPVRRALQRDGEAPTTSRGWAIRTCGGQSMMKHLPLERLYRDSRCGALMLPWTAELCLDRMGRETLYEAGEQDE